MIIISKKIYITTWRNKWITSGAKSIDDFIKTFEDLLKRFKQWKEWGITLYDDGGTDDDYATFATDNIDVAIKAGFTFFMGDNRKKQYLEALLGEEIEVLEEKLQRTKK
ncbi:MAG: hypothetical protein ACFFCY_06255 [Promethearchaeota archaeon]